MASHRGWGFHGFGDVGAFYDYSGGRTRLWLFKGTASGLEPESVVWDSGAGNWSLFNTKFVATDQNHDGYADIVGFYTYGGSTIRAWTFYGSAAGVAEPMNTWFSGVGNWDWNKI